MVGSIDKLDMTSTQQTVRLPDQRWHIHPPQLAQANLLGQNAQLSPLLAQVLLNRGFTTREAVDEFLHPDKQLLPSPLEEFPDLAVSLELLQTAIANQDKIAICGDYDADGMTSTALLLRALRYLGADVDYAIPSRMAEGYGINERIVEEFHAEGVRLILTVDNGIAAYQPIARARELGLNVIITDHHDVPPDIPPANAVLNPKLIDPASPYWGVAGVGVAYILAVCLAQEMGKTTDLTAPLLELFTLGTIADLAPLTGVNRRWVQRGLRLLPKSRITGIQALIQVSGLGGAQGSLKPEAIGFRLGPRINAVGRIADPQVVIDLLTTDDEGVALERAMQCEQINRQRQILCEQIEQDAIALCEAARDQIKQNRVLLLVHEGWHHGVIGIVASRLVERYGVPVFISTFEDGEEGEPAQIRGSARGIPEFNVYEALHFCDDLMTKYGGHRAAGGFTFAADQLEAVRSRLIKFAHQYLEPELLKPLVNIDVQADLADLTLDLYQQIDQLHPCGIENAEPIFWTPNVRIIEQQQIGRSRDHLKVTVAQGEDRGAEPVSIKAIAWRWGEYCPLPTQLDIAYKLKLNEWQGRQSVELELVGVRLPQTLTGGSKATSTVKKTKGKSSAKNGSQPLQISLPSINADESADGLDSGELTDLGVDENGKSLWTRVDFYYNKRHYECSLSQVDPTNPASKELRIRNPEGQVLAIQLQQRRGLLGKRREEAKEVDVSHPHYFNLIRAALDALQLRQKTQILLEKDQLGSEKDKQVNTLQQQLALLEEKINQLSTAQQQRFRDLQSELHMQESAIRSHEAHIAELQTQLEQSGANLDPREIRRNVKEQLGDAIWRQLHNRSQRDLCAAHKNYMMIHTEGFTSQLADYSEAGLRLGFAVEREIVQPFFRDLQDFLLVNGGTEIGGLRLSPKKKYTLGMLPPLLTAEWQSLREESLRHRSQVSEEALYCSASATGVNRADHKLIQQFLANWQHPIATWLQQQAVLAASQIDQISKLRNTAAHAESFLYAWQFELLRSLVMGATQQQGIFNEIYGV